MTWAPDYIDADDLAAYARINDDNDDAIMAIDVTAASRAIDDHCNRQFGNTAAEERFYTPWPDYDRGLWVVDVDDFMTTSGLVVTIADVGTALTTDYVKEERNAAAKGRPWTRLAFVAAPSVTPTGAEYEIGVTVAWGWTAFPSQVVEATRLQASRFASRRDSPYGVAGSPDTGSELRLLARVDPDVAVALRGLVRPRKVG